MRHDHTDTESTGPIPAGTAVASDATGPNPLSEPVPNFPPDVSSNPAAPAADDLETTDLAVLERRLREAINRAERGTEMLEEAIRRRRRR
jgi:hypothetical protein